MSLGIAIPCYSGHIEAIRHLLESIAASTLLPEQVSVSCSSIANLPSHLTKQDWPFRLIVSSTNERKNAAQNRNIAAANLSTELISFIDGDDLVHPLRNQILVDVFNSPGVKAAVHDYYRQQAPDLSVFKLPFDFSFYPDYIDTVGPVFPISSKGHLTYHNAHLTIRRDVWSRFKCPEDHHLERIEDSAYNNIIVKNGIYITMINAKLSIYRN